MVNTLEKGGQKNNVYLLKIQILLQMDYFRDILCGDATMPSKWSQQPSKFFFLVVVNADAV